MVKFRMEEWLDFGCDYVNSLDLSEIKIPVITVVGSDDRALPSLEEGRRLEKKYGWRCHVVEGGGHGSTVGGMCDLGKVMGEVFWGEEGEEEVGEGEWRGMKRREGEMVGGMGVWEYWGKDVFERFD
ncbi:hypothetical protein TrVE_jg6242 [Triparma verrucosa]|uniref:Uncharacterized protein n=1 Tax=Triparma verrucosa TaxID=1606542 RepID=A0A9W7BFS1_9STRA|nr:hypothetical protein TrVE_jg6242 [Triparma verrucosa]